MSHDHHMLRTPFLQVASPCRKGARSRRNCHNLALRFNGAGINGRELWKSDGTASGTVMVKDLYLGYQYDDTSSSYTNNSSDPQNLTEVSGTLFFSADDGSHGVELWKSDGTEGGTALVTDIATGSTWNDDTDSYTADPSGPQHLTDVDGTLFFVADDGTNGAELWKSDGTAAGTLLVKDIAAGDDSYDGEPNNSYPFFMKDVDGTLYFSAFSEATGRELWKSDGTAAGTVLVADTVAGSTSFDPSSLQTVNGTLLLIGYEGDDQELWRLPLEGEGTAGTAHLTIFAEGTQAAIPANVGVQSDGSTASAYTTDTSGTLTLQSAGVQTLGDFFDTWRTNAGLAGNNSSAVLTITVTPSVPI